MWKKQLCVLALVLSWSSLGAQDFCQSILDQAKDSLQAGRFPGALKKLQDAEVCDYENALSEERLALQNSIFAAIQQQRKQAEDAALAELNARRKAEQQARVAKSSALVAQAQKLAKEDPTVALNLAAAAYAALPDKQAAEALAGVLASSRSVFYISRQRPLVAELIKPIRGRSSSEMEESFFFVSPDGSKLVLAEKNDTSWVLDLRTGSHLFPLDQRYEDGEVRFSPDAKTLLTCPSGGSNCKLWDLTAESESPPLLREWRNILTAGYSTLGSILVVASREKGVVAWDIANRKETPLLSAERLPEGSSWGKASVTVTEDLTRLLILGPASRSGKGGIIYFGALSESDSLIHVFSLGEDHSINSVALSPAGKKIMVVFDDLHVSILDMDQRDTINLDPLFADYSPEEEALLERGEEDLSDFTPRVISAHFSPDGSKIVTLARNVFVNPSVKVWNAFDGKEMFMMNGFKGVVSSADFSPDGAYVVTASGVFHMTPGEDLPRVVPEIIIWDALSRGGAIRLAAEEEVESLVFLPGGNKFATLTEDGEKPQIWDMNTGKEFEVRSVTAKNGAGWIKLPPVDSVLWEVNPNGEVFAAYLQDPDYNNKLISTFSADARRVVGGSSSGRLKIWDTGSMKEIISQVEAHFRFIINVVVTPDDKRVLTAGYSDETMKIWDINNGALLGGWEAHSDDNDGLISTFDLSPDGKKVATGSNKGKVQLWELQRDTAYLKSTWTQLDNSFNPAFSFPIFKGMTWNENLIQNIEVEVTCVRFSKDGRRLFIASDNDDYGNVIKVWDVASKTLLYTLEGHEEPIQRIDFSPGGTRIISSDDYGNTRIWVDPIESLHRGFYYQLDAEERQAYGVGEEYRKWLEK